MFILNSPSNPTGAAYTRAELGALGEVLLEHPPSSICTDDMYEHIYWGAEPFCSLADGSPGLYDRTVTVNGVSKSYAMTGWRIGYCGGPVGTSCGHVDDPEPEHVATRLRLRRRLTWRRSTAISGACREMNKHFKVSATTFHRRGVSTNCPAWSLCQAPGTFYAFVNIEEGDGASFGASRTTTHSRSICSRMAASRSFRQRVRCTRTHASVVRMEHQTLEEALRRMEKTLRATSRLTPI